MTEADSPEPPVVEAETKEKRRQQNKESWARFKETRRRIYGTLSKEEYAVWEERAEEAGRAVWEQVHAEATAHAEGTHLPTRTLEEQIAELISQLRRIGNNVNQIARTLNAGGDMSDDQYVQMLIELEALVTEFVKKP